MSLVTEELPQQQQHQHRLTRLHRKTETGTRRIHYINPVKEKQQHAFAFFFLCASNYPPPLLLQQVFPCSIDVSIITAAMHVNHPHRPFHSASSPSVAMCVCVSAYGMFIFLFRLLLIFLQFLFFSFSSFLHYLKLKLVHFCKARTNVERLNRAVACQIYYKVKTQMRNGF